VIQPTPKDIGRAVIYTAWDGHTERGILTSVGGTTYAFVRYNLNHPTSNGVQTKLEQLEWETQ
jgi:hypothetical protein